MNAGLRQRPYLYLLGNYREGEVEEGEKGERRRGPLPLPLANLFPLKLELLL